LTSDRKRRGENGRISYCLENTFKIWMPNLSVKETDIFGLKNERENLRRN
jgi:hypothetical protein